MAPIGTLLSLTPFLAATMAGLAPVVAGAEAATRLWSSIKGDKLTALERILMNEKATAEAFAKVVQGFRDLLPKEPGAWGEGGTEFAPQLNRWVEQLVALAASYQGKTIGKGDALKRFRELKYEFPDLPEPLVAGPAPAVAAPPVPSEVASPPAATPPPSFAPPPPSGARAKPRVHIINLQKVAESAGKPLHPRLAVLPIDHELREMPRGGDLLLRFLPIDDISLVADEAGWRRSFREFGEMLGELLREKYKTSKALKGIQGKTIVLRSPELGIQFSYMAPPWQLRNLIFVRQIEWVIETVPKG